MEESNGLCECGCGNRTRLAPQSNTDRNWIKGEPLRFITGHSRTSLQTYESQDCGFETPCWIWQGRLNMKGYGVMRDRRLAHRVYYARAQPLARDEVLHHRCEQKRCVRPAHMVALTRAQHASFHLGMRLARASGVI